MLTNNSVQRKTTQILIPSSEKKNNKAEIREAKLRLARVSNIELLKSKSYLEKVTDISKLIIHFREKSHQNENDLITKAMRPLLC